MIGGFIRKVGFVKVFGLGRACNGSKRECSVAEWNGRIGNLKRSMFWTNLTSKANGLWSVKYHGLRVVLRVH